MASCSSELIVFESWVDKHDRWALQRWLMLVHANGRPPVLRTFKRARAAWATGDDRPSPARRHAVEKYFRSAAPGP